MFLIPFFILIFIMAVAFIIFGIFNKSKHLENDIAKKVKDKLEALPKNLPNGSFLCPYCGTANNSDKKKCEACGAQLKNKYQKED